MRNGLPDHWAEILGLGAGQVNEGVVLGYVPQGQLTKNLYYAQNPKPQRTDGANLRYGLVSTVTSGLPVTRPERDHSSSCHAG